VCTHGRRPDSLRRSVLALRAVARPGIDVLVVDNARRPVVRGILDGLLDDDVVRVVHERRKGLDRARNRGIAAAPGDVVAYIDDDCEVTPQWADAVLAAFADGEVDCVTGRVIAANGHLPTAQWFERRFSFDRGDLPQRFHHTDIRPWFPVYPFHLGTGCNMAFRRTLLDRIGWFDPALDMGTFVGGGGDIDIFARAIDAGATAAYEPRAVVRHYHRDSRNALIFQFIGYGATPSALTAKWIVMRRGRRRAAVGFLAWYLRDTVQRTFRRTDAAWLPWWLYVAELLGELWGPIGYLLGVVRAGGKRR
jgi:O-antigen biosynthesis protein